MQQYLYRLTERLLSLPDEEESIMTVVILTAEIMLQCPFKVCLIYGITNATALLIISFNQCQK